MTPICGPSTSPPHDFRPYRQVLPGERLSENCGHHCGIRSSAESGSGLTFIAHCPCPECRCPLE